MATVTSVFLPAFRKVSNVGAVIRGPSAWTREDPVLSPNLVGLESATLSYTPEVTGPTLFATYEKRPSILGYRPRVSLSFLAAESNSDPSIGLSLLRFYFMDSFSSDDYPPLQVNMFFQPGAPTAGDWRGMYAESAFDPKPLKKQNVNGLWRLTVDLYAASLVNYLGINEWAQGRW